MYCKLLSNGRKNKTDGNDKANLQKRKADFSIKICCLIWWKRGESNPCPKLHQKGLLRVQPAIGDSPSDSITGSLVGQVV